jgi:catechol 2,3-dioxygenase-like lactoylglutathione lyase family enzyme
MREMVSDHPVFPILLSTDLDASRTFYHDTLGLEILREGEGDRIVFRCGAGTQLVVTLSTIGTSDTQTQMAWRVPDLRSALVDLRARGVRIVDYRSPEPVTTDGIAE